MNEKVWNRNGTGTGTGTNWYGTVFVSGTVPCRTVPYHNIFHSWKVEKLFKIIF